MAQCIPDRSRPVARHPSDAPPSLSGAVRLLSVAGLVMPRAYDCFIAIADLHSQKAIYSTREE